MTQVCCPGCGVRFSRATAAHLVSCPQCGQPAETVPSAEHVLGYRLAEWPADEPAIAVAVAVAPPGPPRLQS